MISKRKLYENKYIDNAKRDELLPVGMALYIVDHVNETLKSNGYPYKNLENIANDINYGYSCVPSGEYDYYLLAKDLRNFAKTLSKDFTEEAEALKYAATLIAGRVDENKRINKKPFRGDLFTDGKFPMTVSLDTVEPTITSYPKFSVSEFRKRIVNTDEHFVQSYGEGPETFFSWEEDEDPVNDGAGSTRTYKVLAFPTEESYEFYLEDGKDTDNKEQVKIINAIENNIYHENKNRKVNKMLRIKENFNSSFFDALFSGDDGDIDHILQMKFGISIPTGFDKISNKDWVWYNFTAIKSDESINGEVYFNKKFFDKDGAAINCWDEDGASLGEPTYVNPDITIYNFGKIINKYFGSGSADAIAKAYKEGYEAGKRRAIRENEQSSSIFHPEKIISWEIRDDDGTFEFAVLVKGLLDGKVKYLCVPFSVKNETEGDWYFPGSMYEPPEGDALYTYKWDTRQIDGYEDVYILDTIPKENYLLTDLLWYSNEKFIAKYAARYNIEVFNGDIDEESLNKLIDELDLPEDNSDEYTSWQGVYGEGEIYR